ncbi:Phytanoyl-CoA dioxygenase domain containing 1 [Carabus blaptoides fortunei]
MRSGILDQFFQDGYVVLEDFLRPEEVEELYSEGQHLIDTMPEQSERVVFSTTDATQSKERYFLESGDKVRYFYEAGAIGPDGALQVDKNLAVNKVGHALHSLVPAFRKYTLDERVKETCWQLGMADPAVAQSMYIYKNAGTGGEVTPHQDASYLFTEPQGIVGFWIALEDATVDNGCLWIARGSHKSGVHRRYVRNSDQKSDELLVYSASAPIYQKSNFKAVPVKKGTCILIHGQVVHYSEPNKSTQSRNAYTFHVIEQRNTKYAEENWLQPTAEEPFLSLYKN